VRSFLITPPYRWNQGITQHIKKEKRKMLLKLLELVPLEIREKRGNPIIHNKVLHKHMATNVQQ
jgi:hypothetical protein